MITLKDILSHIVIKQKVLADKYDEALQASGFDILRDYLAYKSAVSSEDTLYTYKFTVEDFSEFTNDIHKVSMMLRSEGGPSSIYRFLSPEDVNKLIAKKRRQTVSQYRELNPYYRELLGLPPLKKMQKYDKENDTIITRYEEDPDMFYYYKTPIVGVDITKPVHLWTYDQKSLLSNHKFTDEELKKYPYLKNIYKGMDIISLRDAGPFDILWTNIRSTDGMSKLLPFIEMYRLNQRYFLANHYSEYDALTYDNYEKLQCIILFMAALASTNAKYIFNRFDGHQLSRQEINDILDSFGVPRFKMNTKYLNVLANNINDLIYKKGTNINLNKLSDLFHDIKIFKYFLVKTANEGLKDEDIYKHHIDSDGNIIYELDKNGQRIYVDDYEDKMYSLKYIKTPILADDPYPYMKDVDNIYGYRDIVDNDEKWGSVSHYTDLNSNRPESDRNYIQDPKLERLVKRQDFSWTESKYLGMDNIINLGRMSMKTAMLYRWFVDNPTITNSAKYTFYYEYASVNVTVFEMMLYIQCLIFLKYKRKPSIPDNLSSYFKITTLSNKINVEEVKGVLTRVYKETLYQHKEKLDKELHEKISDPINNRMGSVLTNMSLEDLNYIMEEYFERRPVDPDVKSILDKVLWLYYGPGYTEAEKANLTAKEITSAPTEDNVYKRKARYSRTNNIFDDEQPNSDDKEEYVKARENYNDNMANDVKIPKLENHNTSKVLSTIDFLTKIVRPSDIDHAVNRESTGTYEDRMYNAFSRFEVDMSIVDFLYAIRENTSDYRDYEMIDTMIKVLTEGHKLSTQFRNKETNRQENNLLDYLVNLDPKNIAFSKRIQELSEDEENYMSNFDSEIIEAISQIRAHLDVKNHHHADDALENLQRLYTDNEVLRYLEEVINFFKSYTQDFITKGVTYIMDDGNNIVHILEELEKYISKKDWDLGTMFLLMSSYPSEELHRIREVIEPHYYCYTSERLDVYLPSLRKYVEIASSGIYLT